MGASHCTHDDHVVPAITVNWPTIFLNVLGGLVLFLFGVFQLATAIEPLASDRARGLLGRFTTNRLAAVLTGAVATTLLDSSSVTIILVIALVNGGLVTFPQSLGVIMGSNIGTTVSSPIFALDVKQYAPLVTDSRKPANSSHRLAHVLQSEEHQAETEHQPQFAEPPARGAGAHRRSTTAGRSAGWGASRASRWTSVIGRVSSKRPASRIFS